IFVHGCCGGSFRIVGGSKYDWETGGLTGTPPSMSGNQGVDGYQEQWHYNNAWFASRGYVVINYTSRGFVNADGMGSTGETQLDSRRFEVNDLQYLAGLVADDPFFSVNPQNVVVTVGSYVGGASSLTCTDPEWETPA